ncbi:DUF4153 domain-containing protein [Anaeromicropila populeti]|uniref:Uncharacterized protein n=1 Tax=Anaeromicropila populeti TaxID=37658 RepID=A0A1I6JSH2_9FIRM|nr:DUF4173 domain-containing protein [Anaeromicropila populeti]SFR81902.1 protein of unknown function [Anaeromicropila populeti]
MDQVIQKVRQNFMIFGIISLLFGITFTMCFYKAGLGVNASIFTIITVILLIAVTNRLGLTVKKQTIIYYAGIIVLGVSSAMTSSWALEIFNVAGILLLLEAAVLNQFCEGQKKDFTSQLKNMLILPFSSLLSISLPFIDSYQFFRNITILKNKLARNIFVGIAITIPVGGIIIALLSSADLVFRSMMKRMVSTEYSADFIIIWIMTFFGFLVCYCVICGAAVKADEIKNEDTMARADAAIAVTVLAVLCIIYAVFCGIQIFCLFPKGSRILPMGITFSEYARKGFFELLTVTAINIILMLLCTTCFKTSKAVSALLTVITACTYIMTGSAFYRMLLYIEAYHLTFLRLFGLLVLLINAILLGGVILYVYDKKFPLFEYFVVVVSICYIMFSFSKPDYWIASYNIQHESNMTVDEVRYLTRQLSLDAAPAIVPYLETKNKGDSTDEYRERILREVKELGIRDFNCSVYEASKAIR